MFWTVLVLKAVAALLGALTRSLRRAALFLAVSLISDLVRQAFLVAREGAAKPYTGKAFLLWLPDPAMTLAIPTTLFGLVFGWWKGLALWLVAFLSVVLAYPALRGENLLRAYWAFFGAVFVMTSAGIVKRSIPRKITKDEALLLLFGLAGLGDIVLVKWFGVTDWWGVMAVNGMAYISTIFVALWQLSKPKLPVQGGNQSKDL